MIPKSGYRFSEQIMRKGNGMIPKSGYRFSEQIMRKGSGMIPKSGYRFSEQIIRTTKEVGAWKGLRARALRRPCCSHAA